MHAIEPGAPTVDGLARNGVLHLARLLLGKLRINAKVINEEAAQHVMTPPNLLTIGATMIGQRDATVALLFDEVRVTQRLDGLVRLLA